MKTFTVQLAYAAYYSNTVTVEADNLDEALAKAVEVANQSPAWSSSDYSGPTFIEAAAEGDDVDLWMDDAVHQLPVPQHFTEDGDGPRVTITVSGGLVQDVAITDGAARVEVRDYDTDGTSDSEAIQTDAEGKGFLLTDWSNRHSAS